MSSWMDADESPEALRALLGEAKVIAVVGLTSSQLRPSYGVASYLQRAGYQIVPVNLRAETVLGQQGYANLADIPFDVDVVNLFRRPEAVGPHVDEAIAKGAKAVWMQLGIRNDEAAERAHAAGLQVIMDRCIKIDHMRLTR